MRLRRSSTGKERNTISAQTASVNGDDVVVVAKVAS